MLSTYCGHPYLIEGTASSQGSSAVCFVGSTWGEMFVCLEGPLFSHLKRKVREKISKEKYVEILLRLPLEKFNLNQIKPDERKKEECWCYQLILRMFTN